jgi:hypothetical protein
MHFLVIQSITKLVSSIGVVAGRPAVRQGSRGPMEIHACGSQSKKEWWEEP